MATNRPGPPPGSLRVAGVRGGAGCLLAAETARATNRPLLLVTPSERRADLLAQDLGLFTERQVSRYPGYDIPPYTPLSPDQVTVAARLHALYRMMTGSGAEGPPILVASAEALLRRVIPKTQLAGRAELIVRGEETDREKLRRWLAANGYEAVSLVREVGDFSVRGGLVDLFAPGHDNPLRLDFFGDTVESLRLFDPVTQRSIADLAEAVLLPASDILFPPPDSSASAALTARFREAAAALGWPADALGQLLDRIDSGRRFPGIEFFLPLFYPEAVAVTDYLDPATLVLLVDPAECGAMLRLLRERIQANHAEAVGGGAPALPPATLFLTEEEYNRALAPFDRVTLEDFAATGEDPGAALAPFALNAGNHKLIKQEIDLQRKSRGLLPPLTGRLAEWLQAGDHVAFACRSPRHAGQLGELLQQHGLPVVKGETPLTLASLAAAAGEVALYDQPLSEGFDLAFGLAGRTLHLLSESELFGEFRLGAKRGAARRRAGPAGERLNFDELRPGDIVVHEAHGLGVYEGLIHLAPGGGVAKDFLQILYQDNDRLYVPVDRINAVSKYKGLSDKTPKIDRLGGKSWHLVKSRVKEAVWKVAHELLDIYARRAAAVGHAFSPPGELYRELEESFPFDETPDQMRAIEEVIGDLTAAKPMERLICGDVGYGKTEVAVRAAFKVAEDNHQVAVLVPTTVLAEQHLATFRERLRDFPVRVECLTRFRSPAEQRAILADLAAGRVDIVIGTQRLLSKDVTFKRLGLLVVDEEHRFGVRHKEKVKQLRAAVDVLTLTATPIPRTLQMSLLDIRDLSVIATPPEHRRKILTFVARHDDLVIKEAVVRELQRGGQVFLIHNRVRTIHEKARLVQKLVPGARVGVAHGQMAPKDLEEVMAGFVNRELDVLVCTTIVESGLDISSANTIIILRADRLGMAEIYQLRGRVGRGSEQSYAYLLVPSLDGLTREARDRLRALMEYSDLGGGFKLAMSDLQIRGGGNLLGISQSGQIAAVGYDLYLELLQQTVADLKRRELLGEAVAELPEPEINLAMAAFLPEAYIADVDQRYIAYRRLAGAASGEELLDLREELADRYGTLPEETENLCDILELKIDLRRLGIARMDQGPESLAFTFAATTPVPPEAIIALAGNSGGRMRFTPDGRLILRLSRQERRDSRAVLRTAGDILQALGPGAEGG